MVCTINISDRKMLKRPYGAYLNITDRRTDGRTDDLLWVALYCGVSSLLKNVTCI